MTQEEIVLQHLKSGKSITQLEATKKYGITRLAPIIHVLRKDRKLPILTEDCLAQSGSYYARYHLLDGEIPSDEPGLFDDQNIEGQVERTYDTVDRSGSALRQGSPPEVSGTEIRAHHVSNPDDREQILKSFQEYCAQFGGKRVPITADWSRQLLKLNRDLPKNSNSDLIRNRDVRNKKLESYKDHLRNGTFLYTNIGIGFDEEGWLVDGQTRLTASMQTGITITSDVSFDLPSDAFFCVDSQSSARTNIDFARMFGVAEYAPTTVAAVSMLYRKDHGLGHTQRLEPQQVIDAFKTYHDISSSVRLSRKMRTVKAPKGIFAAVHYLASRVNKAVADKAFDDLITGAISDPKDPVLVARERLLKAYGSPANEFRGAGDKRVRVMLSRMFNYRLHGIKVKWYLLDGGDDWPQSSAKAGPEVKAKADPKK